MDHNRDNWDDWHNDRWDNRDDIREDWQDWADHRWHDHDYWHHGCWGGHYDNWWHHMWDEHPVAFGFGLTAWGMNRLNYWFGYSTYYNPYYYETYPVSSTVTSTTRSRSSSTSRRSTRNRRQQRPPQRQKPRRPILGWRPSKRTQCLYRRRLRRRAGGINAALAYRPDDAALHEFRALIMFATGQYRDAAAGLNAVLAVGPGWDWTTLSGLYSSIDTYTQQLRKLEDYIRQNTQAVDARFVLAYHYLTAGHSARRPSNCRKLWPRIPKIRSRRKCCRC